MALRAPIGANKHKPTINLTNLNRNVRILFFDITDWGGKNIYKGQYWLDNITNM